MFHFGFSYEGLLYLLMLFIPNIIWTKYKPEGYWFRYFKSEHQIKDFYSIKMKYSENKKESKKSENLL